MKKILLPLIFLCLAFPACDNDDGICDPGCSFIEPDFGLLSIDVNLNDENPYVLLEVFFDKFGDPTGDFYFSDTLRSNSVSYDVFLDEYYSAAARYIRGNDTIWVVDGDRVRLRTDFSCDWGPCYEVDNASLNLKLDE